MDKTLFSNKVEILGDYYAEVCESESIMSSQLMEDHRDIFFLCLSSNVKWITLEEKMNWFIEDTWKAFCDHVGVDHYGEYKDYNSFMEFVNE